MLIQKTYSQENSKCGISILNNKSNYHIESPNNIRLEDDTSSQLLTIHDSLIIIIPVVVHIVHNEQNMSIGTSGSNNISDDRIISQIQILNEDFRRKKDTRGFNSFSLGADTKIEFCLANRDPQGNISSGITRTYHPNYGWSLKDEKELKSLAYWPSNHYLNIWVTNLEKFLGYSQYPHGTILEGITNLDFGEELDGIVIQTKAFGENSSGNLYNHGRTTTHEVGHWLGLLHLWGDSYCGEDYVNDTPQDLHGNKDNDCLDSSNCNGKWQGDLTNNYMDFSPDRCMNMFTIGQKQRMRTAIATSPRRLSLMNSFGCCGKGISFSLPLNEDFENLKFLLENWKIDNSKNCATFFNRGSYHESTQSLQLKTNIYEKINIESPYLNFITDNNKIPFIKFDIAMSKINSEDVDTINIMYDFTCQNRWKTIRKIFGEELYSTNLFFNKFYPDEKEWKSFFFELKELPKVEGVKVKLVINSKNSKNIFIDNLELGFTEEKFNVNIFPNPAISNFNFEILLNEKGILDIELFTIVGEKVFEKKVSHQYQTLGNINAESLSEGIYFFKCTLNKEVLIKKVLLIK